MNDCYFNPEEQFYCIRDAFDHVKAEVEQNDQDLMDCMLRLYADDQQKERRYEVLEFDFHAEPEWKIGEEETPICNIRLVNIPFNFTEKGWKAYAPLCEMLAHKQPDWLKDADVEVIEREPYESERGMVFPVQINLNNASPEMAASFISFIATKFLPEGNDMEIWAELLQDFDGGYEWVKDFHPDEELFMFGDEEVKGTKILEKFEPEHVVVYHIHDERTHFFGDMGSDVQEIEKEFPGWQPNTLSITDMFMMYKNDVLCAVGLEEYRDEILNEGTVPVTPKMDPYAHTPNEYVDFWKSNKTLPKDGYE